MHASMLFGREMTEIEMIFSGCTEEICKNCGQVLNFVDSDADEAIHCTECGMPVKPIKELQQLDSVDIEKRYYG